MLNNNLIRKTDGTFLIEMMIAMGILAVMTLATTSLVTNSSLSTHSNDLGSQFNNQTAFVQSVLNNTSTCTTGFNNTNISTILAPPYTHPQVLAKIPPAASSMTPLIVRATSATPGLNYTKVQFDKVLEEVGGTSYLLNLHIEAQKYSNTLQALPGNNLYAKDLPMCVTLNPDLATIKTCGPTECAAATITGIAVGLTHTCAVTDSGVKCWGSDVTNFTGLEDAISPGPGPGNFDTLGNSSGPPTFSITPLSVAALPAGSVLNSPNYIPFAGAFPSSSNREIQAGQTHTCIQTPGKGITCWGNVQAGQLGTGPAGDAYRTGGDDPTVPVSLPAGTVLDFSTATDSTCAVMSGTGQVYCWGCNADGQLGRGTTPNADNCGGSNIFEGGTGNVPEPVLFGGGGFLTNAQAISGGMSFFCAIYNNNADLACWGECDNGADLGPNGTGANCGDDSADHNGDSHAYRVTPQFNGMGITQFLQVATAQKAGCVITAPGNTLYCWGANDDGEVGNGAPAGSSSFPPNGQVAANVTSVAGGGHTFCGVISGVLNCWGDNTYGQLGNGTVGGNSPVPVPVTGLSGTLTAYSVGRFSACAVMNGTSVYCWGGNGYNWDFVLNQPDVTLPFYNLGNSTVAPTGTPTLVQGL